jgi:hypothetical protein
VVHYHFPSVQAVLTEAAVTAMRQVLAVTDEQFTAAKTPADAIDAMLASIEQHSGADPMSLLFVEAYLAATRDERLREQLAALVDEFRQRVGGWLAVQQVPDPAATAAVLAAAIDGILLHRGLGSSADGTADVLRRLVTRP